jgi:hypothetical protein
VMKEGVYDKKKREKARVVEAIFRKIFSAQ